MMSDSLNMALRLAKELKAEFDATLLPRSDGGSSSTDKVLYASLFRDTRGYLEKIVHQINGTYERGWYDACAVMIRRLVETLIIESYERHNIAHKIKTSTGDFLYLGDLISATLKETTWNLGRNTRTALPRLKDVGDKSAHSRRFVAFRQDIDSVSADLRIVSQELLFLSGLKH